MAEANAAVAIAAPQCMQQASLDQRARARMVGEGEGAHDGGDVCGLRRRGHQALQVNKARGVRAAVKKGTWFTWPQLYNPTCIGVLQ